MNTCGGRVGINPKTESVLSVDKRSSRQSNIIDDKPTYRYQSVLVLNVCFCERKRRAGNNVPTFRI